MFKRITQKLLLVVTCSFALNLLPITTAWGQEGVVGGIKHGVKKGAEGVKKGAETGYEKTKEGAQTVGRETKEFVTGEEQNEKTNRTKPGETPAATTSQQTETRSSESKSTSSSGDNTLPKTAGELPALAFAGISALLGAGAVRASRRKKN